MPAQSVLVGFATLILANLISGHAFAEKRVALVVGNSEYRHVSTLNNPTNDADDISAALRRHGFKVTQLKNVGYLDLHRSLLKFSGTAAGADIALVFFAGHGIEFNRVNYLIPTDAKLSTDQHLHFEAVPLQSVMVALERVKGLRIVLLDACRNNPFAASMKMTSGTRSIGRGLARIEPLKSTLVSFAAKEGTVAADGEGRNSPFTSAILSVIDEPGLEIGYLFRKVRDHVVNRTGGKQEPFVSASLTSHKIYIVPPKRVVKKKPTKKAVVAVAPDREIAFWQSIKDSKNPEEYEFFLKQFPNGAFAELARFRLGLVKKRRERERVKSRPEKKQTNLAAVAADSPEPEPLDRSVLVRAVQTELARLGCYTSRVDGNWGRGSRKALSTYGKRKGVKTGEIDEELLRALRAEKKRVCPLACGPRRIEKGGRCVVKACPKGRELDSRGRCLKKTTKHAIKHDKPKREKPRPARKKKERRTAKGASCGRIRHGQQCIRGQYLVRCNNGHIGSSWSTVPPALAAKYPSC